MENRIKELRKAACLSQAELADRAGLRSATVSDLENGKSNATLETLMAISSVLECHVRDLFAPADVEIDDLRLLRRVRELPEAERRLILRLIEADAPGTSTPE